MFRTKQKIRRKIGGYVNDDGNYIAGNSEEIEILASIQPLNLKSEVQSTHVNPHGGRTANILKVYSDTEMFPTKQTASEISEVEGDVLIYHNRLWRCIECDVFQSNVISHYRAIFQEIDEDEQ